MIIVLVSFTALFSTNNTRPQVLSEPKISRNDSSIIAFNTPYIKEYSLPNGTWPNAILVDKNGIVWTLGSKLHMLFKFDPKKESIISSYPIIANSTDERPKSSLMSWTMVQDNGGFIWFSRLGQSAIWRFDPINEKFIMFHSSAPAFQMKLDRETGNIWFVTLASNTVGIIQKNNESNQYKITEFNMGNASSPTNLFIKNNHGWLSQFPIASTNNSTGDVMEFYTNQDKGIFHISEKKVLYHVYEPTDVFYDENNSLWFTEHGTSTISEYKTDSLDLSRFPTSSNKYHSSTLPLWIRQSLDGKGLWFNEHGGNRIGFFDKENITLTEYEIPSRPHDGDIVYPLNISLDPTDNNKIWFSEWNTDKIGVLDRSIPLPFDIHSDVRKIILQENNIKKQSIINVIITRKISSLSGNNSGTIYLNATSSPDPLIRNTSMNLTFFPSMINLTKANERTSAQLNIEISLDKTFNSTLAVSASNNIVTKSVFIDFDVRHTRK